MTDKQIDEALEILVRHAKRDTTPGEGYQVDHAASVLRTALERQRPFNEAASADVLREMQRELHSRVDQTDPDDPIANRVIALGDAIQALERQRDRPLKTTDTRVQAMFECPYCERRFLLDTTIRWEGDDSSAPDPE